MNKIKINDQELEVIKLTPYAYMGGKGEKTLQIKVAAAVADFETLKGLFEGTTDAIKYHEDGTLVCEYNGYSDFECRYLDGIFNIELKKGTLVDQVTALHNANETLCKAMNALELANAMLTESNKAQAATIELLAEQNAMLEDCILELSEAIYADEEYVEEEQTEEVQDNGSEVMGE